MEIGAVPKPPVPPARDESALREAARQIERVFLSEMLKGIGVGAPRGAFGGGVGEDQFSSFLREAYADKLTEAGGIGLSESIFRAMSKGQTHE